MKWHHIGHVEVGRSSADARKYLIDPLSFFFIFGPPWHVPALNILVNHDVYLFEFNWLSTAWGLMIHVFEATFTPRNHHIGDWGLLVSDSVLPQTIPHHHASRQAPSVHEAKQTYPSLPGYASSPSEVPKPCRIQMLMTSPTIKLCETNSLIVVAPM